jgi:hypothetical protein
LRDLASIVTVILLSASCALAPAQEPTPRVRSNASQQNVDTRENNTPVIAASSNQTSQSNPTNATSQSQQPVRTWLDWFTSDHANWTIAFLTVVLAGIGFVQWWATHTGNMHNAVIERAYVHLSHTPPGLRPHPNGGFVVSIGMKNNGNTPGDILGGKLGSRQPINPAVTSG